METSEMEMMDPKDIRDRIVGAVQQYFQERDDTTIVSFGNAGARVLKKVLPFETGRINFHSVVMDAPMKQTQPPKKKKWSLFKRAALFEVDLDENRAGIAKSTANGLALDSIYFTVNMIKVGTSQFQSSPRLLAEKILSDVGKSSSIIVVSGFGGEFAQTMHIEFARLLKHRGVAHMSVVIKPSKSERQHRTVADRGIIQLMEEDSYVKVYDNELLLGKELRVNPLDSLNAMDRANDVISRDLRTMSIILGERVAETRSSIAGV